MGKFYKWDMRFLGMEIKFLTDEKNEIEVELPNLTLVELLRVYLSNISDVEFVAWKREHYSVNPVIKVKTKSGDAKAVVKEAISKVLADLDDLKKSFKF